MLSETLKYLLTNHMFDGIVTRLEYSLYDTLQVSMFLWIGSSGLPQQQGKYFTYFKYITYG